MSHDVAFRHQQALDPSALITISTTLHAIGAAIKDCRNAGKNIETDPAVILLARHLSEVCGNRPSSMELRRACMDAIAELRRHPVLKTLCYRGVSYDEAAKRQFHSEGRAAMRRLPTPAEAEIIVAARRPILAFHQLAERFPTAQAVIARFAELRAAQP